MEPRKGLSILLTGATGFLGRPLVEHLAAGGHRCTVLVRHEPQEGWNPAGVTFQRYAEVPWPTAEAVINLAGESIVGLWTKRKRAAVLNSRVEVTRRLVDWMGSVSPRPSVLLSASAVGYYGDRPHERLSEDAAPDPRQGFRWQVCQAWEDEARRAEDLGVRTVLLRLGNVLHPSGGYLGRVLTFAQCAPIVVPGRQDAWVPWIAREDAVGLVADLALMNRECRGALNLTAPEAVTQWELMSGLAGRLGRRVIGSLPAGLLRAALGEFSSAILDDQRVMPVKALELGYAFRYPEFGAYLRQILAEVRI